MFEPDSGLQGKGYQLIKVVNFNLFSPVYGVLRLFSLPTILE